MAKETRRILIRVDTKGNPELKKISKEFGKMNKNIKSGSKSLSTMKNVLLGFGIGGALRGLVRSIDTFKLLQDRITSLTGDAEKSEKIFYDIAAAARFTKGSISGLAEVYNRVSLAVSDLGVSSDAILATTTSLQQTFRLSGSTMAEATGATIQLTQGLSAGALRGQELRSVLESNAVLSGLLAEKFGVARGQLIKFAESGAITSKKVFEVLAENFTELNDRAGTLGQTIEQSLTIAFDKFQIIVKKLNKDFDVSGGIAKGIDYVTDNFINLNNVMVALGAVAIPAIIIGIKSLTAAIASNPIGVALVLLSVAISDLAVNWDKRVLQMESAWLKFQIFMESSSDQIKNSFDFIGDTLKGALELSSDIIGSSIDGWKQLISLVKDSADDVDFSKKGIASQESLASLAKLKTRLSEVNKKLGKFGKGEDGKSMEERLAEQKSALEAAAKAMAGISKPIKIANQELANLNNSFERGADNVALYNAEIEKFAIKKLNDDYARGAITLDKYVSSLAGINTQLSDTEQLSTGVAKGLNDYAKSVGTLSQGIAGMISNTFKGLEQKMFEFVKTGKASFKDLTQSILDDMLRIAIQQAVTKPLAQGAVGSLFSSSGASAPSSSNTLSASSFEGLTAAKGQGFLNGSVQKFATGGVVSAPTLFSHAGGTGLMGEVPGKSEAILPLTRTKTGNLGVETSGAGGNMTVNVINNSSNTEATTRESTGPDGSRVLDVLINTKVNEGFASGSFDRTMQQNYGLRRRGA